MFHSYPYTDFHEMNLDWLLNKFKELSEEVAKELEDALNRVDNLEDAFRVLKEYVDTYFDNLDVQQEINDKLDEMYNNGEFDAIFNNKFTLLRTINEKVHYQVWGRLYANSGAQSMSIGVYNNTPYMLLSLAHLDDTTRAELQLYNLSTNELIDNQTALVGHSNDSTYFDKENCFCIVSGGDNIIHKYNMFDNTVTDMTVSISGLNSIHGIAYNAEDDIFYLEAIINGQRCLASVDSDFTAIINYRQIFVNTELTSSYIQGIGFDGNYIYFCYGQQKYGWQTGTENLDFGQVDAYTKSFIYVDSVLSSITNEMQAIDFYNGKTYLYYTNRFNIGLVFVGNVNKTKDTTQSQLFGVKMPMGNRGNIADIAYISNKENAGFSVDGSRDKPFCNFAIVEQIYKPDNRVSILIAYFMEDHDTEILIDGSEYNSIRFESTRAVTLPRIEIGRFDYFYLNGGNDSKRFTVNYISMNYINFAQLRFVNFDAVDNGETSAIYAMWLNELQINAHSTNRSNYFITGLHIQYLNITTVPSSYPENPMIVDHVVNMRIDNGQPSIPAYYFRHQGTNTSNYYEIPNANSVVKIYHSGNIFMKADHPDNPSGNLGYIRSELVALNLMLTFTERLFSSDTTPKVYKRNILFADMTGTVSGDSGWYEIATA